MNNKIASPWQRVLAYIIDAALYWLLPAYLFNYLSGASAVSMLFDRLSIVVIVAIFVYPVLYAFLISFFISYFGGTPGKLLTGTRIVSPNGSKIGFWRAFFRNHIGYMISGVFLWAGFIWIFLDKERRGWHDQIADTYVVFTNKAVSILGVVVLAAAIFFGVFLLADSVTKFVGNGNIYNELMQIAGEAAPKETPATLSK